MTVRMRHTVGQTGSRRSHHALTEPRLSTCSSCGSKHIRHQACSVCGIYRGRTVLDAKGKQERSLRRKQVKIRARGEAVAKTPKADKEETKKTVK
ncbi:MAG: 50S ribosomal protein L32 [Candidatus Campbellbacteria bacterium]|nr:50S ribosomal protein L32 [Candidatus Campbellbacteria bacterium]